MAAAFLAKASPSSLPTTHRTLFAAPLARRSKASPSLPMPSRRAPPPARSSAAKAGSRSSVRSDDPDDSYVVWWMRDDVAGAQPCQSLIMSHAVERSSGFTKWIISLPIKDELKVFVEHRILHIQARFRLGNVNAPENDVFNILELCYDLPHGSSRHGIRASVVEDQLLITVPKGAPAIADDDERIHISIN